MSLATAIIVITLGLMVSMSVLAARRIAPRAERLTMQWNREGKPNWSLPRNAALAFTPALAAVVLIVIAMNGGMIVAILPVCVAFLGAHALHLILLARRGD
jgi:hypothetical protein